VDGNSERVKTGNGGRGKVDVWECEGLVEGCHGMRVCFPKGLS